MKLYTTNVPDNERDHACFTNPLTQQTYYRGKLNIRVDRAEILGDQAYDVVKKQKDNIPETTHPGHPAILDPTHVALGPFMSGLGDNLFFDAVLNVGTHAVFGYNHPAIYRQMQRWGQVIPGFIGAGTDFYFHTTYEMPTAPDLAELINEYAREGYGGRFMTNFSNSGTEANENACKIAMFNKFRQLKQRLGDQTFTRMCEQLGFVRLRSDGDGLWSNYPFFVLSFEGAFHGRTGTTNSMSLSKTTQKEGYQAMSYALHLPYDASVDFEAQIDPTPLEQLIEANRLKAVIDARKVPVDLLSLIILEPVQGEGGYVIPEDGFLHKLNEFLSKYKSRGICLISDEVQAGLFRTGEFSAMKHWCAKYANLKPDVMTFAKPLHVGAAVAQAHLLQDWPRGKFSGTWSEGNLLAIAVAFYTLQELREIDPAVGCPYAVNAQKSGVQLRDRLAQLAEHLAKEYSGMDVITNIRGIGQMNAFDLPSAELRDAVEYQAFLHGLHIIGTGRRSVRLFGTVDQRPREAEILVQVLGDSIRAALAEE
jgi:4-aminobutyrate aminotransferase